MDNKNEEHESKDFEGNKVRKLFNGGAAVYEAERMPLWFVKARHGIFYTLGVIEILLAFRFLFKLLGANPLSGFVIFIYSLTGIFTAPFKGIFNTAVTGGLVTRAVFEPATVIAVIVYAIIAWGLVKLLRIKVARDG